MLMAGKNIRQNQDPLQDVSVQQLSAAIRNPKPHIKNLITQLRAVQAIDPKRYRQMKVQLPYVTCGKFNPRYRKTENFGNIENFIVDIDHLAEKDKSIAGVKADLSKDPRVEMIFTSPSDNGLKVFFRLKEKCYDPKQYSIFYKIFVQKLAQDFQLEQVVDAKTSDVTRACFVSIDPDVYYNPTPELIDMKSYVDFDNPFEVRQLEKAQRVSQKTTAPSSASPEKPLTDDLLDEIKRKLNPNIRKKPQKQVYVPKELENIIGLINEKMQSFDINVKSIKNIQYGKQFVFSISEVKWAEINVFYGKKGFRVVKSTKSGSDSELADVCFTILCDLFY